MNKETLRDLYDRHEGKVSDKWQLYLTEYERLFKPYRDRPIRLLEIGVQNGGSLEIWAKYFSSAKCILGCDINPKCATLEFEDPRIDIIVGDINDEDVRTRIAGLSPELDIIIDDGSHTSRDIVKAFVHLFPLLANKGLYIVEDLHCSYWQKYEGGLHHPYSSMAFFKKLADVINEEHWGLDEGHSSLLGGFEKFYGLDLDDANLDAVQSIEFSDSICALRKRLRGKNLLGTRVIAGRDESVRAGHIKLSDTHTLKIPSQADNPWADRDRSLTEELLLSRQRLEQQDRYVRKLRQSVSKSDARIHELSEEVRRRDRELYHVRQSNSWRWTAPLRQLWKIRNFDERYYLEQNPDVERAGVDPFEHYETRGRLEGRAPGPLNSSTESGPSKALRDLIVRGGKRFFVSIRAALGSGEVPTPAKRLIPTQENPPRDHNDYTEWVRRFDTLTDDERRHLRNSADKLSLKPVISVLMPTYNTKLEWLEQAVNSVREQLYEHWELCIADDASTSNALKTYLSQLSESDPRIKVVFREQNGHISAASNSALEVCSGDWVALMDHDDLLAEHALYHVAVAVNQKPEAQLIYSDEDKIGIDGARTDPYFKCDWNPELLLSQNMISHLGVYRREIMQKIGGFREGFEGSQDHDMVLRYTEDIDGRHIVHIPRVLYHWRKHADSTASAADSKPYAAIAGEKAVQEHLDRQMIKAKVEGQRYGYRIYFDLPQPEPSVTIIVPTRNGAERLRDCIESIKSNTLYDNYRTLVVDNGSDDPATLKYLESLESEPKIRVRNDPRPFNFAGINNAAVHECDSALVALVNDDIKVISPDWLGEMVSIACQPGVAA
ncbi:MAG: glycosyltransferase, partial [Gammaproteobacteria bacterium]|nr:glycosyltransferase [Gammaproteobacteria bacterium]